VAYLEVCYLLVLTTRWALSSSAQLSYEVYSMKGSKGFVKKALSCLCHRHTRPLFINIISVHNENIFRARA